MFVKADASAPMSSYEVRISNKSGAIVYEWNDKQEKYVKVNNKLPYDEVYQVVHEQIINKELYASVYREDKENTYNYLIKLSDVTPLEINLSDYKKDESVKYLVFEEGVYLYKGPSKIYGKLTPEVSLPVGTTFETKYYEDMWAYTEYNGQKGWVYKYSDSRTSPYEESSGVTDLLNNQTISLKTIGPVSFYANPKTKEVISTIPTNTELNNLLYLSSYYITTKDRFILVEYNGQQGWIHEGSLNSNLAFLIEETEDVIVANPKGISLYKHPNNKNDKLLTIPYATKLTPIYSYNNDYKNFYDSEWWYQVNYNGKIGWINTPSYNEQDNFLDLASIYNGRAVNFTNTKGLKGYTIYKNINDLSTEVLTLPNNTTLTPKYYVSTIEGTWYFVEYEEQQGWVYLKDYESNKEYPDHSFNSSGEESSSSYQSSSNYKTYSYQSFVQKILAYVSIVIVVSLTATVTVILINKKKKDNNASK